MLLYSRCRSCTVASSETAGGHTAAPCVAGTCAEAPASMVANMCSRRLLRSAMSATFSSFSAARKAHLLFSPGVARRTLACVVLEAALVLAVSKTPSLRSVADDMIAAVDRDAALRYCLHSGASRASSQQAVSRQSRVPRRAFPRTPSRKHASRRVDCFAAAIRLGASRAAGSDQAIHACHQGADDGSRW